MFGAIEILAVVLLFIEPASYRLRSKGWRASPFVWGTVFAMVTAYLVTPLVGLCGGLVFFSLPVLLFLVSLAISTRSGSPGVAYLRMRHPCPHCGHVIRARRRDEGRPVLCESCSALVTLPGPGAGPPVLAPVDVPKGDGGAVCLASYLHPQHAEFARELLESSGVGTILEGETLARCHPMMSFAGGGVRLVVAGQDAVHATEILQAAAYEGDGLIAEAGARPFEEVEPEGDGMALRLLVSLVLLVVVPVSLSAVVFYLGPMLVPDAFLRGVMSSEARVDLEMLLTLVILIASIGGALTAKAARRNLPKA